MSENVWVPTLWMDTFQTLANELDYGDKWSLNFTYKQAKGPATEEEFQAHGNFQCRSCKRKWPSAYVTLLFRFQLRSHRGSVTMRPCGQACRECEDNRFHLPGFKMENVEYALSWLFKKIRRECYGERVRESKKSNNKKKHTKPHEDKLCEGCRLGVCRVKF